MRIPGHERPLAASHCPLCYMYHTIPRYKQLIDGDPAAALAIDAVDCIHRGPEVLGVLKTAIGLSPLKMYYTCEKRHGKIPGYVCSCEGCHTLCPDYADCIS